MDRCGLRKLRTSWASGLRFDTETFDSLWGAGEFVRVMEELTGAEIGCVDKVTWRDRWITKDPLVALAEPLRKRS